MEKDLQDKLNKGYKRMAILITILGFIGAIPVLFIDVNYVDLFVVCWFIYIMVCLRYLPKIIIKLWKL